MEVYAYEHTIEADGALTLKDLPFDEGQKIEVIIIPRSSQSEGKNRYPLWGQAIAYHNPTEPVGIDDWDVLG